MNQHPPNLDPMFYGKVRDEINKILCPFGIPEIVSPAPPEILDIIKCNCSSKKLCSSKRCTSVCSKVAAVGCANAVVIQNVALTKKQNLLMIYLQMMRIKKYALVGYFILF